MTKRILALLLCLALCLSMIPASFAEDIEIAEEPAAELAVPEEPAEEPADEIVIVPEEPAEPEDELAVPEEPAAEPAPAEEPEKTAPAGETEAVKPGAAEIQASTVATGSCGENVEWKLYDDGELYIYGEGPTADYPVEYPDFYSYKSQCTSIVVADGVTTLGNYLFYGMNAVTSVTLGKDLTSIGTRMFGACTALTEVHFKGHAPASIDSGAFDSRTATVYYYPVPSWTSAKMQQYGATKLTWTKDDKCGDNVTWMLYDDGELYLSGSGATYDYPEDYPGFYSFRDEITYVEVPKDVTTLGTWLFFSLTALKTAVIEGSPEFKDDCFRRCEALEGIYFYGSAPTFSSNCFLRTNTAAYYMPIAATQSSWTSGVMQNYGGTVSWALCDKLGDEVSWNVDSSGELNVYGTGATWDFDDHLQPELCHLCDKAKSVVVEDGVTELGWNVFWNVEYATSLSLPDTLTKINVGACMYMEKITEVTIPASVTEIGDGAFGSCYALKNVKFLGHAPTIADDAFEHVAATVKYYPLYSWTSDKLQDYGTGTLTWVCDDKVGDNVKWKLDEDGTLTMSGTGPTWDFDDKEPGFYYFSDEVTSAVVGEGVTVLGVYLFFGLNKIVSVQLPSTLTKIGDYAFNCFALTSIEIPAGVTEIGNGAFYYCTSLKEIRFLGAAPSIGDFCFYYVTATAYYPSDEPSWTEDVRQNYGGTITWVPFTPMTLNGDAISATLPVHDSMSLVVKDSGGTIVTDASWSTSDPGVATVDEKGVITAVKYGKCTITASTEGGINTAECALQTLFWDVADSSKYYFKHVYWAAEKGITKGYDLEYFDPQGTCTREQMMTFLWRLAGQPNPKTTSSPFPDVKSGAYYYKAVLWGVEKGITNGYSSGPYAGKFGVGLACTREQAMTFLWRMAGKPNPKSLNNKFSDVKSSDYFFKAVLWAAENGIANGYADGTYGVGLDCLREHMVTFLSRYDSKFPQH